MGSVLMTEGRPKEALEFGEKGLKLEEDHADGVDSTVLITKYDVASLYFNAEQIGKSLKMHKEVLHARIETCGRNCQYTSESYEAVRVLLHLRGKHEEAA